MIAKASVPTAILLAVLTSVLAPLALSGQSGAAIRGRVIDDSNSEPVADTRVTLFTDGRRLGSVAAGADGSFLFALPTGGYYQLEARRIGYQTTLSQQVLVERDDTLTVEFRILPDAILLAPLLVTARSNRGRDLFERRRVDWGEGIFLTPEMIDSIAPRHVGDVFRNQEKVWLSWGWGRTSSGASGPIPRVRTFLGSGCMDYMVNKLPVRLAPWLGGSPWAAYPMDGVRPEDIVAVEIYRYVGEAPPEIRQNAMRGSSMCGLTVFWTREGW